MARDEHGSGGSQGPQGSQGLIGSAGLEPRRESTALAVGGGAFLLLAGFFLWRDLALPREVVMLAAVALAAAAAALGRPRGLPALGPGALLVATAAAGGWYAVERVPGVLPALLVALIGAVAAVARAESEGAEEARTLASPLAPPTADRLRWAGLGLAVLASSGAFYFHFLAAGVAADSLARRLVPTLLWLALGLAFFVGGRRRARPPAAWTGMALVVVALGKAIFYDTTHLHGPLRVAVLGAVGALLLGASRMLAPSAREERAER